MSSAAEANEGPGVAGGRPPVVKAPLKELGEIEPLLRAGASHFYAGLSLAAATRHPLTVVDRRGCSEHNVATLSGYRELADEVGRHGSRLYLTLNALQIPRQAYGTLHRALGELRDSPGLGGVIVGNLRLTREIRERHPGLEIVGSIVLNVSNRHAVDLFRDLGIRSFVLDRSLRVEEVASLTRHAPESEFSAILFHDHCGNVDGACHFLHDSQLGDDLETACMGSFVRFHPRAGRRTAPVDPAAVRRRFEAVLPVRDAACGACLVWRFHRAGVRCFKVAGRIHTLSMKLDGVRRAVAAVRCLSEASDEADFVRRTQRSVEQLQGHPCRPLDCLVPFH